MKKTIEQGSRCNNSEDGKGSDVKRFYNCPHKNCEKIFTESGNLKAHIRTHVTTFNNYRPVNDLLLVLTKTVQRPLLLKDT